jgi:hypothetical protein
MGEVPSPGRDETIEPIELGQSHGGLHVRHLEIVAKVTINIFVVISMRQIAKLPIEPLLTRIVLSWCAPAIATPITDRFDCTF